LLTPYGGGLGGGLGPPTVEPIFLVPDPPPRYHKGVEGKKTQGHKNADAYRQGMRDAAERTNFGRPSRTYPTDEEQLSYEMGFYEELEAMEEEGAEEG